jgi:glyoxylase-like metal-dependent hydrolase (beta-lactamase superfamily II)
MFRRWCFTVARSRFVLSVINTHHHFDHSGGIRTAIAEGATIITHEGNKAFIEAMASRPHTMTPDALSKNRNRQSCKR